MTKAELLLKSERFWRIGELGCERLSWMVLFEWVGMYDE